MKFFSLFVLISLNSLFSQDFGVQVGDENIDIYSFVDQGENNLKKIKDSLRLKKYLKDPYVEKDFYNTCYVIEGNEDSIACAKTYFNQVLKNPYWNVKSKDVSGSDIRYVFSKVVETQNHIFCKIDLTLDFQDFDGKLLGIKEELNVYCYDNNLEF